MMMVVNMWYNIDEVIQFNQMKAVQLSANIRFLSLADDEGTLGLFIVHSRDSIYETREVHSKEEFTEVYEELRVKLEQVW